MTDDAPRAATSSAPGSRRRILGAVIAVIVLASGIAVFVLGRAAASTASDDLALAQRNLRTQQVLAKEAKMCERGVRNAVPPLVKSGEGLIYVSGQLVSQDAALVASAHDQQAAGIAANIGSYNAAAARGNAAATAANGLNDALQQQLSAFGDSFVKLPAGCGPPAT